MPSTVNEWIIYAIRTLGAAAFALSGSILAMTKKTDPFGTVVVAITTIFGGGILRDIIMGKTPPAFFTDWDCYTWIFLGVAVSLLTLCLAGSSRAIKHVVRLSFGRLINAADALGLAVFCVQGVDSSAAFLNITLSADSITGGQIFIMAFMGFITGVGGGALRDIFTGQIPMIFRRHIYALPAIGGSLLYIGLLLIPADGVQVPATVITIAVITLIRIMSAKYHWELPMPYRGIEEAAREEEERLKSTESEKKKNREKK